MLDRALGHGPREAWTPARADDPWERTGHVPCGRCFEQGARYRFRVFLESPSRVAAASLEAVCGWLSRCRYTPDAEQFGCDDLWLNPALFERVRAGDCDDYALWGWRKLRELGYDATLVVGWWTPPGGRADAHVWVLFTGKDGAPRVLEGVNPRAEMVRPLDAVRAQYYPMYGVDGAGAVFSFRGGLRTGCACVPAHERPAAR